MAVGEQQPTSSLRRNPPKMVDYQMNVGLGRTRGRLVRQLEDSQSSCNLPPGKSQTVAAY